MSQKKYFINVEVSRTMHKALKLKSDKQDLSMAQWVRMKLREALAS